MKETIKIIEEQIKNCNELMEKENISKQFLKGHRMGKDFVLTLLKMLEEEKKKMEEFYKKKSIVNTLEKVQKEASKRIEDSVNKEGRDE